MIKQWFTLLELILVVSIMAIIFLISRSLFTNPNQELVGSEICINTINGEISKFFYQGVAGKDHLKDGTNIAFSPDQYLISLKGGSGAAAILFSARDGSGGRHQDSYEEIRMYHNSCDTNKYVVGFSWNSTEFPATIIINKGLSHDFSISGMSICVGEVGTGWVACTQALFSARIDYVVCPKHDGVVALAECKHTLSMKFDTATQSMKTNKCLDVSYIDSTCKKWSNDNF